MIRKRLKKILLKYDLYYRLKYSRLFHFYQLLFKSSEIKQQKNEVKFYRSFLPACKLIFDIGGNDGHKTQAFLEMAEKVICCEPDNGNFQLLETRFRNKKNRVIIEKKALSDKQGNAVLHIHHHSSAFNTLSNKWVTVLESDNQARWNEKIVFTKEENVETTTLDILIGKYGVPDFVKIDVEGFEESVLKGLSRPVAYLSFETLLPDYKQEFQNCIAIIESLDDLAKYNIAIDEKLILPEFVNKNALEDWLQANNLLASFEVIAKMGSVSL